MHASCRTVTLAGQEKYIAFLVSAMHELDAKYYLRIADTTLVAPKHLALAAQQVRTFYTLP